MTTQHDQQLGCRLRASRYRRRLAACLALLFWAWAGRSLWAVPNPVIPRLADCGVMRYQGRYYISGTWMGGKMRVSDDLVHWTDPVHVFSMHNDWTDTTNTSDREIHACDMTYHNGLFHFYWSVNHFPLRQIGHALATQPTGPYDEPVTERWFDGRIDPHLLISETGACYFFTVKFTDGNVIWGQPMRDPWTLTGKPKPLLSALAGTWEQLDPHGIRVNEAPWVIHYRDRYYLLYNANHTATKYGNYGIGCAEARQPLGFSNSSKYDHPVLKTNRSGLRAKNGPVSMPQIGNCGQPSVVHGPNGFEWWIVYFAVYADGPKSQAIDRVLFVDRHLHVDGPTDPSTPGDHPPPALPTWRALFRPQDTDWVSSGGRRANDSWRIDQGALRQSNPNGPRQIVIPSRPARHYLFAASLCMPASPTTGQAGLVVAHWDAQHQARVGLRRGSKQWFYRIQNGPDISEESYALPEGFDARVAHTWKIFRNGHSLRVLLDGRPAAGTTVLRLPRAAPALPGLFTEETRARFDALTYTIGWDEWDRLIDDWGPAAAGAAAAGDWRSCEHGLQIVAGNSPAVTFKGDLLQQYEFQVQMAAPALSRHPASSTDSPRPATPIHARARIGSYPIYVDSRNYLRTTIGLANAQLLIEGQVDGQPIVAQHIALPPQPTYHLRVVKRGEQVSISINAVQVGELPDAWPAAQVGLLAQQTEALFNDITRFHLR